MKMINYTTINHRAREMLGITWHEYGLADLIYHLSHNPKSTTPGWCYATKEFMAEQLGFEKRSITSMIGKLLEKKLLEKHPKTKYLRTTQVWFDAMMIREEIPLPGRRSSKDVKSPLGKNLPSHREDSSLAIGKNLPSLYKEDNTTDSNSDNLATPSVAELVPEVSHGKEINEIMELFQMNINPLTEYGNKTQRKAIEYMIQAIGIEKLKGAVHFVISCMNDSFAPVITTPYQLKMKFAALILYKRKQNQMGTKAISLDL